MYACQLVEGPLDGKQLLFAKRPPREIRVRLEGACSAIYVRHYPRAELLGSPASWRYLFAAIQPRRGLASLRVPSPLRWVLSLLAIVFFLIVAARGETQTPDPAVVPEPPTQELGTRLARVRSEANGCQVHLSQRRFAKVRPPTSVGEQRARIALWRERKQLACRRVRFLEDHPKALVRFLWPDSSEELAIRVAGCESTGEPDRLYVDAKNPDSTASGLFQELDGWWKGIAAGGSLNFLGGRAFSPFDPFANVRQALWLWKRSHGVFSVHWAASAGCWS